MNIITLAQKFDEKHLIQIVSSIKNINYLCEVKTTDCPLCCMVLITFHSFRLATGSTPVLGSSKNMIGGSATNAIPILNFLLFPPLYVPHFLSAYSSSPIRFTQLSSGLELNHLCKNCFFIEVFIYT